MSISKMFLVRYDSVGGQKNASDDKIMHNRKKCCVPKK